MKSQRPFNPRLGMSSTSTPATLPYLRDHARGLLNEFDAADGLASYYTLHHDPNRTTLYVRRNAEGIVDGFLAVCQTGFDLFRPLVTLRVRGDSAIPLLVEEGLAEARPYLLIVPPSLLSRLEPHLTLTQITPNIILRLEPRRFTQQVNVLVVQRTDPEGNPRTEIKRDDETVAAAGVNWRSPVFAEVYVSVKPEHRGRGWGRAVVTTLVAELLKLGVTPLYTIAEGNADSRRLAERVGFVDTGAREVMAQAVRA